MMEKNFTPEQIEIINRVVFARVEQVGLIISTLFGSLKRTEDRLREKRVNAI